jgi:ubiquinone/menaquinone biosynthesis C-methylase UbiE
MNGDAIEDTYEPFSREPEYIEVNRLFIRSLHLTAPECILDLACGTGTLMELLLEEICPKRINGDGLKKPQVRIIGLDISRGQLQLAKKHFSRLKHLERPEQPRSQGSDVNGQIVNFIQASADRLPISDLNMQAVIMGNAIQLCDDKERVIREVNRVLQQGGTFAFNTSFYAGTYVPGTERFYLRWVEEAISYLKKKDAELRRQGLGGIARKKSLAKPAFSRPWLSQSEYEQLLDRNGFEIRSVVERTVQLTQHSFETIGAYAGLAGVLLSGYPIQLACEALEKSAGPALAAVNLEIIPRYWIELIASKR